jgi:hypothetical protein
MCAIFRETGFREQAAKIWDLRPRMLLAFASTLQARLESEVEPELLASEA